MESSSSATGRIATLDMLRGAAVMGILAMNIVSFAMPPVAYINPAAYGMETSADFASWLFSFIFVDGKMRGLFSFLFGAGILLVISRAQAAGRSPRSLHFRRLSWLLLFGLLHFYFLWYGDILSGYAVIGMLAWRFRNTDTDGLVKWSVGLLIFQFLLFALMAASFHIVASLAVPDADPEILEQWAEMTTGLAVPSPADLQATIAPYRDGTYGDIVGHQLHESTFKPLMMVTMFGPETLAYMLLGMAGLRSGFLTGEWTNEQYRRTAMVGFGIGVPAYALLAWLVVRSDFSVPMLMSTVFAGSTPFRPAMIAATAASIILLMRRRGPLVVRIEAAGRAAFTNYLGTSLIMTTLFYGYGFGLFGSLGRAELWLVVVAAWGLMLLWSKPWLDRFAYGPFEWLWRSLTHGRPVKIRIERSNAA